MWRNKEEDAAEKKIRAKRNKGEMGLESEWNTIRLSEKFLSFHKVIIDEQQLLFYIILLN